MDEIHIDQNQRFQMNMLASFRESNSAIQMMDFPEGIYIDSVKTPDDVRDIVLKEGKNYCLDSGIFNLAQGQFAQPQCNAFFLNNRSIDKWNGVLVAIDRSFHLAVASGNEMLADIFMDIAMAHECAEIFYELKNFNCADLEGHAYARAKEFEYAFQTYGEEVAYRWFNLILMRIGYEESDLLKKTYLEARGNFHLDKNPRYRELYKYKGRVYTIGYLQKLQTAEEDPMFINMRINDYINAIGAVRYAK